MRPTGIRLRIIVIVTLVFLIIPFFASFASQSQDIPADSEHGKYIVYYFHTDYRCSSCERIEEWSRAAVRSGFAGALKKNHLQWRVRNVEKEDHKHFVQDFGLYTKSLVIVEQADGKPVRWKNLEKVWQLLRNKKGFADYVQSEIKAFMEKS